LREYSHQALVIIPFKAKGFAYLLDFAFQELHLATLLNASRLQSWRPLTSRRKTFQKSIAINKGFFEVRIGGTKSLFLALFSLLNDYRRFRRGLPIRSNESSICLNDVLQCRLAAFMGDRNFKLSETPFYEFLRHHFVCKRVAIDFERFLNKSKGQYSTLVVYNGREPLEATCIKFAKQYGMNVRIIERGSDASRYQVFETSPHYHPDWWELITNNSNNSFKLNEVVSSKSRDNYIQMRLKGVDTYFDQAWNMNTPENFPLDPFIDSKTVIYFSSSSTEFSPFPEYNYDVGYKDQYQAVRELAAEVSKLDLKLAIRRHPNSIGLDGIDREHEKWIKTISNFHPNRVKYFGPKEKFNTLSSLKHAHSIFVWKSSIGFESLALGKPTFALATAKWSWDPALRCWNKKEILDALTSTFDPFLATDVVNKFADFMSSSGTRCILFSSAHKWGVITSEGKKIQNGVLEREIQKMRSAIPIVFGLRRT
jgi:hypothetical protein